MTDDIVARLRLYAERQKQTRSTVLGLLLSDSADEIERLREELTASHESHGNEVGALTERLSLAIHERDEARREVCDLKSWNFDRSIKPEDYALLRKWGCFPPAT